ncbi:hypothetical protein JHE00_32405 [Prauserella sp. ASG 168]|uniref:Methyltransferase n=2 Tax=Prauserella cavernicola TaxID=2800127 RepID=A0A934V7X4_9PSEU|nr:hypothetical protein [Prauserella cavernicola]
MARTLAELRIPDLLHDQPRSAKEIADAAGTHPEATRRLMRCAVYTGLAAFSDDTENFSSTPLLDRLRADAPDSLRSLAIAWNSPGHWKQWERLPDAVRAGHEQSKAAHGKPIWEYFAENPGEADLFSQGAAELTAPVVREAISSIPTTPGDVVVDVGGATGTFVLEMLERHQGTTGVVFDLPHVMDAAKQTIADRGLAQRCSAESGDFFTSVPEGDLYLLKFILHDWDDDACVTVLERCRAAMKPSGRIVIVDMVIGPPATPGSAALMDLNMLSMTEGHERELADLDRIFAAAGLRRSTTTALAEPYFAVEAVAV